MGRGNRVQADGNFDAGKNKNRVKTKKENRPTKISTQAQIRLKRFKKRAQTNGNFETVTNKKNSK